METLNGARLFRGWKCDHISISRSINGGEQSPVASKLSRGDTVAACGGNDGLNGYAEPVNVAILGEGRHRVELFDDGEKFAEAEFDVILIDDDPFLRGDDLRDAQLEFLLPGFPGPGEGVYVTWFGGEQGFFTTEYLDGRVVADDWADLTDGTLNTPVRVKADGSTINGAVWTGTDPSGDPTTNNCSGWTTTDGQGTVGVNGGGGLTETWTEFQDQTCTDSLILYCFEQ